MFRDNSTCCDILRETGTSRLVSQLHHATITPFMRKYHGHLKSKKYALAWSRSKKIKFVSFSNKISNFLHLLLSISIYNVKLKRLLLNKTIAHELCVDKREVLEFVLVYVCDDVLVRWCQFGFFSCEISVEISHVCSWSLWKRNKKYAIQTTRENMCSISRRFARVSVFPLLGRNAGA